MVDEYRYLTGERPDLRVIEDHPRVIRIAEELGYRILDVDNKALNSRYLA